MILLHARPNWLRSHVNTIWTRDVGEDGKLLLKHPGDPGGLTLTPVLNSDPGASPTERPNHEK